MEQQHLQRPDLIDFRGFVKDCAQEPALVEFFNRFCGANLRAPIAPLLDDSWPELVSEEEQMMIGYFIVFVHQTIWGRLKTAAERTGARIELDA